MTDPRQLDLEEAIAAAKAKAVAPTTKSLREAERERLAKLARELEAIIQDAKPGSPLRAELNVRTGQRAVSTIVRRAQALSQVTSPDPHITHPTRERVAQAGEDARVEVAYDGSAATGVKHRWLWPVEMLRRDGLTTVHENLAADRFRRAFNDASRIPKPTTYLEDSRSRGDPSRRDGLTPANHDRQKKGLALAGGEAGFAWKHLTSREKGAAWALILEEPFTGHNMPLSMVQFGATITGSDNNEPRNRDIARGVLIMTLARLVDVFAHLDRQNATGKAATNSKTQETLWKPLERKRA